MKRNTPHFGFLLLSLLQCCNQPASLNETPITIDTTMPYSVDSLITPRELFYDVEYIRLQSPDIFFLTEAKKIIEFSDKLFILDKNKKIVVAYDLDGNFINQLGKKGKGPEEYESVYDFDVDINRDLILVFSSADQAVLEYDSDLTFKRKVRFNIWSSHMSVLASGNIAFYNYFDEGGNNIRIFNIDGKEVGSTMPYPKNGSYTPMDYSGFVVGDFYSYPLSSLIYKISEKSKNDAIIFDVNFPGKRSEDKIFHHDDFFKRKWLEEHILTKFTIGNNEREILFYYSYTEGGISSFTLGGMLASGQVFSHLNMKHGFKSKSDPYSKLFFNGPYNLPTFSKSSGYYYVASTLELIDAFYSGDKIALLSEIQHIDNNLYQLLQEREDHDNPLVMRFKLLDKL
jgi:hypothetical protein